MRTDDVEHAMTCFHEALLVPEGWPRALEAVAKAFRASGVSAQMIGGDGTLIHVSPSFAECVDTFVNEGWFGRNPRVTRGLAMTRAGHRGFVTEYHMFTPEELARDPYQNEFATRFGQEAEAGIVLAEAGESMFILTAPRAARIGSYDGNELERMNRFVSYLKSATSLALRTKTAAAVGMMETLAGRGQAVALLSPLGRVLETTPAFDRLAALGFALRQGFLHAPDPAEDARLQALFRRSGAWLPGSPDRLQPVLLRRGTQQPLLVRCMPIAGAARDLLGRARTLVTIETLQQARPDTAMLVELLGLSLAEARLAGRIATGQELREAAQAENITYGTARARLKSVFEKTDLHRQTELALLIARLAREV